LYILPNSADNISGEVNVNAKMNILSSFTHPHVVPNISTEYKRRIIRI